MSGPASRSVSGSWPRTARPPTHGAVEGHTQAAILRPAAGCSYTSAPSSIRQPVACGAASTSATFTDTRLSLRWSVHSSSSRPLLITLIDAASAAMGAVYVTPSTVVSFTVRSGAPWWLRTVMVGVPSSPVARIRTTPSASHWRGVHTRRVVRHIAGSVTNGTSNRRRGGMNRKGIWSPSSVDTTTLAPASSAGTNTSFGDTSNGLSPLRTNNAASLRPPRAGMRKDRHGPAISVTACMPSTMANSWRKDSLRGPRRRIRYSPTQGAS